MGTHRKLAIAVSASNGENVTGLMSIAVFTTIVMITEDQ